MGRKKRNTHEFKPETRIVETPIKPAQSERLTHFYDLVEMAGFSLPWQLKEWHRFFLSEASYLDEAEQWLSLRLQGVLFPKVTDDVDRKRMATNNYQRQEYDGEYWESDNHWGYQPHGNWAHQANAVTRYYTPSPSLPLTPLLPAPSGRSATAHHCV